MLLNIVLRRISSPVYEDNGVTGDGATNGYKEHIGDLDRGFTRSWRRLELLISKF